MNVTNTDSDRVISSFARWVNVMSLAVIPYFISMGHIRLRAIAVIRELFSSWQSRIYFSYKCNNAPKDRS